MAFSLAHDVHLDGYAVRIRCAGTGRPLLLLHDLGGSGASFAGVTSAIVAAGREAVAPDLPGFAQSDPIPGELAELVGYLHRLADEVIAEPIDVVGRGFGGYLALTLAAERPHRFRRVVLEDPMSPPAAGGGRSRSRMAAGMALSGAYTTVRRGRLLQNIGGFGRAKALLDHVGRADPDWWDALGRITAECLLLDLGGGRPEDRDRYGALLRALPDSRGLELSGDRSQVEAESADSLLAFVA